MTRCYVCTALPQDGCQAIGGEIAECPRPMRSVTPVSLMVAEARLALEAHGRGDLARYAVHQANARRIAEELDLQVVHARREERDEVVA